MKSEPQRTLDLGSAKMKEMIILSAQRPLGGCSSYGPHPHLMGSISVSEQSRSVASRSLLKKIKIIKKIKNKNYEGVAL